MLFAFFDITDNLICYIVKQKVILYLVISAKKSKNFA